jgi:hypothetical protein
MLFCRWTSGCVKGERIVVSTPPTPTGTSSARTGGMCDEHRMVAAARKGGMIVITSRRVTREGQATVPHSATESGRKSARRRILFSSCGSEMGDGVQQDTRRGALVIGSRHFPRRFTSASGPRWDRDSLPCCTLLRKRLRRCASRVDVGNCWAPGARRDRDSADCMHGRPQQPGIGHLRILCSECAS